MTRPIDLVRDYGLMTAADGSLPALAQVGEGPIILVNHFALREHARYDSPTAEPCSGVEAMMRYAAVSGERLEAVGGRFLAQGLGAAALWGDDVAWDLVVVASYPSAEALMALLDDTAYRDAFVHRRAAIAHQRVNVSTVFA